MSDAPTTVEYTVETLQPVVGSSGSVWGYVLGGIAVVALLGYVVYKKANTPSFVIKQMRKRNQKEMKKQGIESAEAMIDLDQLLNAVESYANDKGMSGTQMVQLLAPLNDKAKIKSATDLYGSMSYIAKSIDNMALAKTLGNKAKQVRSSSALMAGLLKRAGV